MSQVNKYADKAGYTADKNRKDTQSAVSYVEDDGVLIYDGVNTVIRKSAAGVGDLVVFDKTDSTLKFIKGDTLVTEKIPPQLIPVAVVYARQGERVLIVSLRNAASSVCWAYSYEVALSGFELSAGGTFTLRIYNTDHAFTYAPGATLADIAAQINADEKIKNTYGWTASVDEAGARIVMSINTWSPNYVLINVTNGCQITYPRENVSYQTTLTGILIKGTREEIRRKNGVNSNMAGGVLDQFAEYYSERGQAATGTKAGKRHSHSGERFHRGRQPRSGCRVSHLQGLPVRRAHGTISYGVRDDVAGWQDQHEPDRAAYLRGYLRQNTVPLPGCRRSPRLRHHRGRNDDGAGGGGMVAAVVGRGLPADARQGVFRR